MNNKIIHLGFVSLDWSFAKGHFICNHSNSVPTNAFDRVICGLLLRSNHVLPKYDIATIMGFNVIDDPHKSLYCDLSEKAIFDDAVSILVEYGLVVDNGSTLMLTEAGKLSYETKIKYKQESTEIDLWASEFSGDEFNLNFLNGIDLASVEEPTSIEWNSLLNNPLDVLRIQKSELVDTKAGRNVTSLDCLNMTYYVANIKCAVCYNVESQAIFLQSITESENIDYFLSNNCELRKRLLDEFFKNKNISVIKKPSFQEEAESIILSQESRDIKTLNLISCTDEFMSKVYENIKETNAHIVFFNLPNLTSAEKQNLQNIKDSLICVDFVPDSSDNENYIVENNICYYPTNEPRTSDICVFNTTYFSIQPFIISYNNVTYNIPLVYKYEGDKYVLDKLFAPYYSYISKCLSSMLQRAMSLMQREPAPAVINNILSFIAYLDKLSLTSCLPENQQISDFTQQLFAIWNNYIQDRISELESDFIAGISDRPFRQILNQIEKDVDSVPIQDKEIQNNLSELRNRIEGKRLISMPRIQLRTIFILDTSVFMNMPKILDKFDLALHRVVVPRAMEQELDGLTHVEEKKKNASMARLLLRRKMSDYPHFVSIKDNVNRDLLPIGFDPLKADNDMLAAAIELINNDGTDKIIIVADDDEFIKNVNECVEHLVISDNIEGINHDELLIRLSD